MSASLKKADPNTLFISRTSVLHNAPRPDVADMVLKGEDGAGATAQQRAKIAVEAILAAVIQVQPFEAPMGKTGRPQLARSLRDGRAIFTTAGNTLRGFAKSALLSAYFEGESAARAWNRYAEAQAKADAEHGADATGPDGTPNGLDLAASRAMDAVTTANVSAHFAAELALLVEELGDGEFMQVEWTPRAREDGTRSPAPKAAATLRNFLKG